MNRATVNDVESRSYRVIEWAMMAPLASLVLVATGFVLIGGVSAWFGGSSGTVRSSGGGAGEIVGVAVAGFVGPVLLLGLAGALFSASLLTIVIAVYFDSKTLETADISWRPNPLVFLLLTLVFQPFVFYYLYKRHEYVVDWVDSSRWGTVVAGSLVLSTLLAGGGLVAGILGQSGLPMVLVSLGVIALAPFPYAIYRDSTYVRLNSGHWQPNPGVTFPAALVSVLLVPPSYLLFGGYYLYKRRQALDAV